jgi:hypothetical protein
MYLSQGASNNIVLGSEALDWSTTTANDNVILGKHVMRFATSAAKNIVIGHNSTFPLTTAIENVIVGNQAGAVITTESNNTLLGNLTNISAGATNATALGNGAVVTTSNSIQLGNASVSSVNTSGTLTAGTVTYPRAHGTAGQVLTTAGSGNLSWGWAAIREVADQSSATAGQTSFTLTQTPAATNSKMKMYINGLRVSNTAYTISGTTLTYTPSENGGYVLLANDRVQFDYYY